MDPLSITTGALALLGVCVSVYVQLRKTMVGAGEAKARVGGLLSDVDNLRNVLQSMEATLDDLEARSLFQNTGHIGAHWQSLSRSLQDGKDTLTGLEEMLIVLNKDVSVLDSTRRYLRVRESSEKIVVYRQHVLSYRDAIQFSLQTITFWNTTLIHGQTADLGPKVEEVDRKVHELSDNLEVKLQALTVLVSTQGNDKEAGALDRLKDTVRSAATVLSAASTVVDASDIQADNARSNASVSPWEPDENFQQWMATAIDFTTVTSAGAERRPASSPHYLNDTAPMAVPLIQAQDSRVQLHNDPAARLAPINSHPRIPTITTTPNSGVQIEDKSVSTLAVPMEQERLSPPLPSRDEDIFQAVTVIPDQTRQGYLGSKLFGSHTRSSSAPSALFSTVSLVSPKVEKSRFWKRSRAGSPGSAADLQSGLKVHEPRSSASLSATNIASEDNDMFRLMELYTQARWTMNVAKIPPPTKRRGKTCVKAVYVGDGDCGKTCSMLSFSKGSFPQVYVPTVFESYIADVSMDEVEFEIELCDTAGQEDYDRLRPLSYPAANVIMMCFTIGNPDSLDNVHSNWVREVSHFCKDVPRVLVGLKSDLRNDPTTIGELMKTGQTPVTIEEGTQVARDTGCFAYYECSAKTGEGIHGLWEMSLRCLVELWGGKATVQQNKKKARTLRSWLFHRP